ncbi:MAG: allantoate amidohydrolase [Verrucomicrobiota bacterium]|nr:allantoate amidohydrolase [Verrucomicrobiota bacterium]
MSAARIVMQRIEALGKISEEPHRLTRTFCSPAMRRAHDLVASWMRETGMTVREDAIGNLIGHYPANKSDAKIFLLGSHLDTVRDAGKFDGPLGVLIALACVQELHQKKIRLPFAIEVVGFADEEGVRYQAAYLGSKVLAGNFDAKDLKRIDANGISMSEAIQKFGGSPAQIKNSRLNPKQILGYAEVHIEQGPVLEKENLAIGIVTAIAGQTRVQINFAGCAGHAGTTPMNLRKDALCAAAEFVLSIESYAKKISGLVATVGQIEAKPGASNVIPADVNLTLDVRHQNDSTRKTAHENLNKSAQQIAQKRGLKTDWQLVQEIAAVPCSTQLSDLLAKAAKKNQSRLLKLPSGAGHDAAVISKITPVAMLFVRCKSGLSHHPDESVKVEDVQIAIAVMNEFLEVLAKRA